MLQRLLFHKKSVINPTKIPVYSGGGWLNKFQKLVLFESNCCQQCILEQRRLLSHRTGVIHINRKVTLKSFPKCYNLPSKKLCINFTLPVRDPPYLIIAGNCQGNVKLT